MVTAGQGTVTTGRPAVTAGYGKTPSHVAPGWVAAVTAPNRMLGPLPLATPESLAHEQQSFSLSQQELDPVRRRL